MVSEFGNTTSLTRLSMHSRAAGSAWHRDTGLSVHTLKHTLPRPISFIHPIVAGRVRGQVQARSRRGWQKHFQQRERRCWVKRLKSHTWQGRARFTHMRAKMRPRHVTA